jgi:hypothetical protein
MEVKAMTMGMRHERIESYSSSRYGYSSVEQ